MNDKMIVISNAINSGENFLAHYGIKGQQWGQRRFQNEDGTLTEEGRRRYGLNPKYANMTDKEMRDILERKRTQNEYIQNVTAGTRKKQQDIKGLTTDVLNVAGQGINIWDKTILERDRNAAQSIIDAKTNTNKTLVEGMKRVRQDDPEYIRAKENIEINNRIISEQKDLKKNGISTKKNVADTLVNAGKTYAPDLISKGATSRELNEKTAEAQRNIEEMDHEQLKKVVDRMKLEKQYDELMNPPKPSKVERGREVLQTIGAILGVTLTALSIAEVFKKLGKKGEVAHSDLIKSGEEFLAHYRTKGSRNGVRRYQNEDGSLTPEGYRHYGIDPNGRQTGKPTHFLNKDYNADFGSIQSRLAMERNRLKLIKKQGEEERRQARYTQKFAERQALRDAKNQIRIQNIYDRQMVRAQQEQYRVENQAKAENRTNLRKNIIKGVAATAFIGAALYTGRHFLQQRALDNQLARDVTKMNIENKAKIDQIREQIKPIQYEKETERYKAETTRMENKALNENKTLGEKIKNLDNEKNKIEKERAILENKNNEIIKEKEYLKGKVEAHDAERKRLDEINRKRKETRVRNAKINEKEIKKLAKNGKFVLSGLFSGSIKQLKGG